MSRRPHDSRSHRTISIVLAFAVLSVLVVPTARAATPAESMGRAENGGVYSGIAPGGQEDVTSGTSGRLLVRFRSGVSAGIAAASASQSGARGLRQSAATGWTAMEPAAGVTLDTLREAISRDPAVEAVEVEHLVFPALAVSDPLAVQQWALDDILGDNDISAQEGWGVLDGREALGEAVVAVIDSGMDLDHPDLVDNLWRNEDEVAGNGVDDDGNGYIDDVVGWDFRRGDADPTDVFGHGSHVAGIIAARTDNATGVAGVAGPRNPVRVMPIVIFDGVSGGSTLDAAEALRYAVDNGATVVNISWGGADLDGVIVEAVEYALEHDVVLVCAAGNSSTSNDSRPFYPASLPHSNVIAVAATSSGGTLAAYSNRGATSVDLAAPGSEILSTYYNGGYYWMSGTSMATPHVTGAVALAGLRFPLEHWTSHRLRVIELSRHEPALEGLVASASVLDLGSILATSAPGGSMILAEGATRVRASTVTMRSDVWGAASMSVDAENDGEFDAPRPFDSEIEIELPPGNGERTVVARYFGETGPVLELSATVVVDSVAPNAPQDVVAESRNGAAELSWRASTSDDVEGYTLWMSADPGGSFVRMGDELTGETRRTIYWLENGATYYFRVKAVDIAGNESAFSETVAVVPEFSVDRVQGDDRYATAVALSQKSFPSAETVVITTGEKFPDAVVASSLAGALEAPLLFVRAGSLPASTANEIIRLGAARVVIVGGTGAVSDTVADALPDCVTSVERVAGANRYETSARVAEAVRDVMGEEFAGQAFVVRGDAFPDAVSVASAAYAEAMPVLLVQPTSAPWIIVHTAKQIGVSRVFVAGGVGAVADETMESIGLPFTRASGATRYSTSVAVAELAIARGWSADTHIGLASGQQFADALSGGAALGSQRGIVLLSSTDSVSPQVSEFVSDHAEGVASMWLLGGEGALSSRVLDAVEAATR